MIWLILSAIASLAIIIGSIVFTIKHQPKKVGKVVVVMKEPLVNLMMPVMLIALCGALLYLGMTGYKVEGGEEMPLDTVSLVAVMCALVSAYGILFTLLKQVVAYKDKVVIVNLIGREKTILWEQVTKVKTRPMTKKVTFYVGHEPYSMNGAMEPYKKFIALANRNISTMVAGDALESIDNQINSAGNTLRNKRR